MSGVDPFDAMILDNGQPLMKKLFYD